MEVTSLPSDIKKILLKNMEKGDKASAEYTSKLMKEVEDKKAIKSVPTASKFGAVSKKKKGEVKGERCMVAVRFTTLKKALTVLEAGEEEVIFSENVFYHQCKRAESQHSGICSLHQKKDHEASILSPDTKKELEVYSEVREKGVVATMENEAIWKKKPSDKKESKTTKEAVSAKERKEKKMEKEKKHLNTAIRDIYRLTMETSATKTTKTPLETKIAAKKKAAKEEMSTTEKPVEIIDSPSPPPKEIPSITHHEEEDDVSTKGESIDGASIDGASTDGASTDGASTDGASTEDDEEDSDSSAEEDDPINEEEEEEDDAKVDVVTVQFRDGSCHFVDMNTLMVYEEDENEEAMVVGTMKEVGKTAKIYDLEYENKKYKYVKEKK
jgi:hypothetical protein